MERGTLQTRYTMPTMVHDKTPTPTHKSGKFPLSPLWERVEHL
jgi:hypothetical protein